MVLARLVGQGPLSHTLGFEVSCWLSAQDSLDFIYIVAQDGKREKDLSPELEQCTLPVSLYWSKPVLRPLIQGEGNISIVLI